MTAAHDGNMTCRSFGFARTSLDRQALDRQVDALCAAGVAEIDIVIEHGVSGDAAVRDGLAELLLRVRDGDEVLVAELSRLGRRTVEVLSLLRELNGRGIVVRCLQPAMVFDGSPMATLLVTLLAAVAEMELETLRIRTREGLASARARGRVGGRPAALSDAKRREVVRMRGEGRPTNEVAAIFGVSERTVRRAVSTAS
ncbi:recombinase family protein [Microbacterium sp. zg-YB36]|uniref:recombinase family protein n=1 Tax=Microbacterium sp. zg-YB36 TaxID=2969407 RepID=UPI00214AAE80|nr:recombinase family protein [Microbacterium sp. zg-YB36]MDL5352169.1 recombinase family protein [Microbacterium sp. zg-YB36]